MPTQIQVTLGKTEKATHEEIKILLMKISDFATAEGYDVSIRPRVLINRR